MGTLLFKNKQKTNFWRTPFSVTNNHNWDFEDLWRESILISIRNKLFFNISLWSQLFYRFCFFCVQLLPKPLILYSINTEQSLCKDKVLVKRKLPFLSSISNTNTLSQNKTEDLKKGISSASDFDKTLSSVWRYHEDVIYSLDSCFRLEFSFNLAHPAHKLTETEIKPICTWDTCTHTCTPSHFQNKEPHKTPWWFRIPPLSFPLLSNWPRSDSNHLKN